MGKIKTLIELMNKIFDTEDSDQLGKLYKDNKEYFGHLTLFDCLVHLFKEEMFDEYNWEQDKVFVQPSSGKIKKILREMIDLGYMECYSEEEELTIPGIFKMTFLLIQKGMYCIAAEFFASALSCNSDIIDYWKQLKNDPAPNLRSYIEKFADKDVNLQFMKGLLHG